MYSQSKKSRKKLFHLTVIEGHTIIFDFMKDINGLLSSTVADS